MHSSFSSPGKCCSFFARLQHAAGKNQQSWGDGRESCLWLTAGASRPSGWSLPRPGPAAALSGGWRRRIPLRRAGSPTLPPQAPPELQGLLPAEFPAVFEQGLRLVGDPFAAGHLQGLAPAVPAGRAEMQDVLAIADPALLRRERRSRPIGDVHEPLRPPPAPSPAGGSGLRSSCGSDG